MQDGKYATVRQQMAEASMAGDASSVKHLLSKYGKDEIDFHTSPIEWKDSEGTELVKPAVFVAIDFGHLDVVKAFLEDGLDVHTVQSEDNGYTLLQWAAWTAQEDIIHLLLEYGAKVDEESVALAREEGHGQLATEVLLPRVDVYASLEDDDAVMEKACRVGDASKVKELLQDENYDYNKWKDEQGQYHQFSPMYMAVKFGHLDIVQLFLEAGVDIRMDEATLSADEASPSER